MTNFIDDRNFYMCKKCGFTFVTSNPPAYCDECGGDYFVMPVDKYEKELEAELDTVYRHDELTNTLAQFESLPELERILDKHNIPHDFDKDAVRKVIEKQDEMCAGLTELRLKREKRKRANGIKPGMNISCPYCQSGNVRKINFTERMIDLGGKKLGKQWHCMSCGSDF